MTKPAFEIHVNRKDFHQFNRVEKVLPSESDLDNGQILVKVDQFAFTANNITYAVVGEVVGYWNFFPVSDEWGIIPVWGFADVVASRNEEIEVGERFYGYYPMGSHLIMSPAKIKPSNFMDGVAHRRGLPSIYNNYINTKMDPAYRPEGESIQSLFRPLFSTSFLIDDFLADSKFYGSKQIVLTSASSKTAIGLAFLLSQRKKNENLHIVGLTSERNVEFVSGLDYYDEVLKYDELDQVATDQKSVIVDFSGNDSLQANLKGHLGDNLAYNCMVGMADWIGGGGQNIVSFEEEYFFAPLQARKRINEWGLGKFQQKVGMAWFAFTSKVDGWMIIEKSMGAEGLEKLYLPMLEGKMDPKVGHVVELR